MTHIAKMKGPRNTQCLCGQYCLFHQAASCACTCRTCELARMRDGCDFHPDCRPIQEPENPETMTKDVITQDGGKRTPETTLKKAAKSKEGLEVPTSPDEEENAKVEDKLEVAEEVCEKEERSMQWE